MRLSNELLLDRRSSERIALHATVTVRPVGGFSHEVALHDLSASGCRVELVEACEPGDLLFTRLPQIEALFGTLRWVAGPSGGVEFARQMHPAVLDAVAARLS